jgi:hypothetical protein
MRLRKVITLGGAGLALVLVLVSVVGVCPLPPDRILKTESSPDGTRTATYAWRPSGVLGAVTKDNPWVYLTIRDRASGRVLARYSCWADVPEEAEMRLAAEKPWK